VIDILLLTGLLLILLLLLMLFIWHTFVQDSKCATSTVVWIMWITFYVRHLNVMKPQNDPLCPASGEEEETRNYLPLSGNIPCSNAG